MILSQKQIRFLREQAHHLTAIVRIGDNGLSEAVVKEIKKVLGHHELVKIKIPALEKDEKDAFLKELAKKTKAYVVQTIGHTATLYKQNPDEPKISLPKS